MSGNEYVYLIRRRTLDLSTNDAEEFDVFLFGGILGDDPPRGTQHMNRGGPVYDS